MLYLLAGCAGAIVGFGTASILSSTAIARGREDGWAAAMAQVKARRKAAGKLSAVTRREGAK